MGVCSRCVWPVITLIVIVVAAVVYVFYPPFCISTEPNCATSQEPATMPATPATRRTWETDFHLPTTIRPSFYSILIMPDLATGVFAGTVSITLDVTVPAEYLLVNIDGLQVSTTWLSQSQARVRLRETFEYSPNQFWVVLPEEPLQPGPYILHLEFAGSMTRDIVGIYSTNYTDAATGEARYSNSGC